MKQKNLIHNIIYIFTYVISLAVALADIIFNDINGFWPVYLVFAKNFVPATITFAGVVILQNIVTMMPIAVKNFKMNLITFIILSFYIIIYIISMGKSNNVIINILLFILTIVIALTSTFANREIVTELEATEISARKTNSVSGNIL